MVSPNSRAALLALLGCSYIHVIIKHKFHLSCHIKCISEQTLPFEAKTHICMRGKDWWRDEERQAQTMRKQVCMCDKCWRMHFSSDASRFDCGEERKTPKKTFLSESPFSCFPYKKTQHSGKTWNLAYLIYVKTRLKSKWQKIKKKWQKTHSTLSYIDLPF